MTLLYIFIGFSLLLEEGSGDAASKPFTSTDADSVPTISINRTQSLNRGVPENTSRLSTHADSYRGNTRSASPLIDSFSSTSSPNQHKIGSTGSAFTRQTSMGDLDVEVEGEGW